MTSFWHFSDYPRLTRRLLFLLAAGLVAGALFLPSEPPGQTVPMLTLMLLLLAAGTWFLLSPRCVQIPLFPTGPALIALSLSWGLSALWSRDQAVSLNALLREFNYLLVFLLAFATARQPRTVLSGIYLLLAAAGVLALYGVIQQTAGLPDSYARLFGPGSPRNLWEHEIALRLSSGRVFSLFSYPNLLAGFLAMALPLGAVGWKAAQNSWIKSLCLVLAALFGLCLAATGSIAGWVCAGFGLAVAGLAGGAFHSRQGRILALAALAVWSALGAVLLGARGFHAWGAEFPARWANWSSAVHMACLAPWTGVGLGLFGAVFPEVQSPAGFYVRYAHCMPLHLAGESGFFGLAAWLAFFGCAGWQGWRQWRSGRGTVRGLLSAGLLAGAFAGWLHAWVDLDLNFLKTSLFFWFLLGAGLGIGAPALGPKPSVNPETVRASGAAWEFWLSLMLSGIGLAVLWRGGKSPTAQVVLFLGTAVVCAFFFLHPESWSRGTFGARGFHWGKWLQTTPLAWPLGALAVWAAFSAMVSGYPAAALPGLALLGTGLLLYLIAVRTAGAGDWLIRSLAGGAVGMALLALVDFWETRGSARPAAGWPNPNLLASFLATGMTVWACGWVQEKKRGFSYWLCLAGIAVIFLALLATGSKAGMVNAAAGLGAVGLGVFYFQRQSLRKFFLLCGVLAAVLAVLPGGPRARLLDDTGEMYERWHILGSAVKMAVERPWVGHGPGNFGVAFSRHPFPNVRGWTRFGKRADFAHNEILQLAACLGFPALGLMGWLFWRAWVRFRQNIKNADLPGKFVYLASGAGLAGMAAQSLADFNWHPPALWIWGMLLLGTAMAPAVATARLPVRRKTGILFQEADQDLRRALPVLFWLLAWTAGLTCLRPLFAESVGRWGDRFLQEQNLRAASRDYERALLIHPFAAEMYERAGRVYTDIFENTGQEHWFQKGKSALENALRLNRLDGGLNRWLGRLYAIRGRQGNEEEKRYFLQAATSHYQLAAAKFPYQAVFQFELGNLYRDQDEWADAKICWKTALSLESGYAAAWNNLGVLYSLNGQLQDAQRSFQKALSLQPVSGRAATPYEREILQTDWEAVRLNLAAESGLKNSGDPNAK